VADFYGQVTAQRPVQAIYGQGWENENVIAEAGCLVTDGKTRVATRP